MTTIRGWSVSTDDANNNYRLVNSVGWFPLTIPLSYVPGNPVVVEIDGGLFADGTPFPEFVDCFLGFVFATADDAPPHSLPLSTSGYSWAPGRHFVTWIFGSPSWTDEGTNPTASTTNATGGNTRDYTLIDGAGGTPDLPGEGCFVSGRGYTTPYGWFPVLDGTQNEHPAGTYSLQAGQQLECAFFTQTVPNDNTNPTHKCYPQITAIRVIAGGTTVNVPLDSVTVGFGPQGSTGNAWPAWPDVNADYGKPWNTYRAISPGLPPLSGGGVFNDDGVQDLFIAAGAAQRSQGHIF